MKPAHVPFAVGMTVAAGAIACGMAIPLPRFFPFSDVVVLGTATVLVSAGLQMMLPSRFLWTEKELALHALVQRFGPNAGAALRAAEVIETALERKDHMLALSSDFAEGVQETVAKTVEAILELARIVGQAPNPPRSVLKLLTRAELVEDTIIAHARLKGSVKPDQDRTTQIARARQSVQEACRAFLDEYDRVTGAIAEAKADQVTIASEVSIDLMGGSTSPIDLNAERN